MTIKNMTAETLKARIEAGDDICLIDCREIGEWNDGHIEQAKFMPLSDFSDAIEKLAAKKSAEIIIQCRSGKRSMNACKMLEEEGFADLTNLEGGIIGWAEAGYPIKTEND